MRLVAGVALLLAAALLARDARGDFQVFTTADGLAGDGVNAMLQDRGGRLWFGTTANGISRFDGDVWTPYSTASGLPGNQVFDLVESSTGQIWAGTDAGVARWDGTLWRSYGQAEGISDGDVVQVIEDRQGNMWARIQSSDSSLARFDGTTWTTITTANGLVDNRVNDMIVDRDGTLWCATFSGVSRFDGSTWSSFTTADGLVFDHVTHLLEARSGAIWFATLQGLSRRDGSVWTSFTTADGLPRMNVDVLIEDDLGRIWAGTTDGVGRYDGVTWTRFGMADGLADNAVDVALKDSRGQLWFGHSSSSLGLTRWDGLGFDPFAVADGLAANKVSAMLEDQQGNLWFSTGLPGSGVTRFDGATARSWRRPDVADNKVIAVEADSADTIWVATANGLNRFNVRSNRYDGSGWSWFPLPGDSVNAILEEPSVRLWFGTNGGLIGYDGRAFTTEAAVMGSVLSLYRDVAGNLWAGTYGNGVYRFDGSSWSHFGVTEGLANDRVNAIVQSRDGAMWFGTADEVSRFDGVTWSRFGTLVGLASRLVYAAARDSSGNLWFGTDLGVSRYDGSGWRTFTEANGLSSRSVLSIHVAPDGVIWFGTLADVSRYDGRTFTNFGPSRGLAGPQVRGATSDRRGRLWFGSLGGVSRLEPDRVAPRVVVTTPDSVVASRTLSLQLKAAFDETRVEFSHAFDGEAWSAWSAAESVPRSLPDGVHTFAARARDVFGNVQDPPTTDSLEVDATPPAPILAFPSFGQAIRGQVAVVGTASDARFRNYRVVARPPGAPNWNAPPGTLLAASSTPVTSDTLASWDTRLLADGVYELGVIVNDTLDLEGIAQIRVAVDNVFPFVEQTSPARIVAAEGGHVYSTNGEVHLFFPPNAFDRDAVVTLDPVAPGGVPDSLGPGVKRVTPGFDLGWSGARLVKPATLEFTYARISMPYGTTPALYIAEDGTTWRRIGGTHDAAAARVAATVESPGRLALFAESAVPQGGGALSALALTPRVFAPNGGFANTRIAIGFSLGRAAPVTVKIYNRAGRLVREVANGLSMGPGANLVYWDGRDRNGGVAIEGLYLVTVEALDEKRTQTLAVVR